jgi:hypothetical protein
MQLATRPVYNWCCRSCKTDWTAVGSGSVAGFFSVHATGLSNTKSTTPHHTNSSLLVMLDWVGIVTCGPKQCFCVGPLRGAIVMDMPPEVHGLR